MNGDIKVYCITFYAQGVNLAAFTQYLYDSADIVAFWNYIPLVYCVKSRLSATDLTKKIHPFFPPAHTYPYGYFMVAEIKEANLNGVLPKDAWDWFYLPHHEKNRPPSLTGIAAVDLGLLPFPTKPSGQT